MGLLAIAGLLVGCDSRSNSGASAGDQGTSSGSDRYSTNASTNSYAPDNTGVNKRDRSDAALTSDDQGGSQADRETSRLLRRAITDNDQLSTQSKNIKIITKDGKVTLRGPVPSQKELDSIKAIVQQSGVTGVDNQLEVKTQ